MLRANVGDKYVLEEMQRVGATLGANSPATFFPHGDATTGDGLLTALRIMEIMVRSGKSLADLAGDLKIFRRRSAMCASAKRSLLPDSSRPRSHYSGGR